MEGQIKVYPEVRNEISSLADLAPWSDAPILPYAEAVEYVADRNGLIEFRPDGVTVQISDVEIKRKDLVLAVQVLETLDRIEKRLKEVRHEIAQLESRRKSLQEANQP